MRASFAASSDNVHRSVADNSKLSAEKLTEICAEFANMNNAIDRVHAGGKETTEEALKLAENITEIRKFIKDIQDISSRTNLLSFNASIEAARAGEAGKGFRIIANEVKSLSQKTQEATRQAEEHNLEQVEHLAQKAMAHTIQVDDELSFLFELQSLFDYIEAKSNQQKAE